ncbi:MAG: 3',5'-cyclic-AMP phosphodiesterase [Elainellaceae cyanobacterium]
MAQTPLLVAQITDTHLFADPNQQMMSCTTATTLRSVVQALHHLSPKPDLLLMTGDLSQDETLESYQNLQNQVDVLNIPTYWIPGNHDVPAVMNQVLTSGCISPQKYIQANGWNFVLLDSALPNHVEGQLSVAQLDWLEQRLLEQNQPTVVVLHHHPLPIGSTWMDRIGLQNSDPLFEVIDRYPHVKLVLFGHIHQEFEQYRNGVCYLGTPSTCVQFKPDSDGFAIDSQPAGFRLLKLLPNGEYSTLVKRVS